MKFKYLYLILVLVSSVELFAQTGRNNEPNRDNLIERLIETISENTEQNIDFTTLTEDLYYFYENPINLNQTTAEQLEKLYVLDEQQIRNILNYIKFNGPMVTIYELSLIKGIDFETIQLILPFVEVNYEKPKYKFKFKRFLQYSKHEVFLRYNQTLQRQKGYIVNEEDPTKGYLGSPQGYYARYRMRYGNNFSLGITADKDPGEEFFKGSQKQGFDFYSAHLFVRDVKFIKALAIGDYQAQFGQGLTFWSGLAFGKTSFGTNLRRNGQGLRPYTSVNENLYMRGGAITIRPYKLLDVTLFYSNKNVDATITSDTTGSFDENEFLEFSTFTTGGLHRTLSEISKIGTVNEQIIGGNISFTKGTLKIGFTGVYTKYSANLIRNDEPYNFYRFSGRELNNIGINYQYIYKGLTFFGETARSGNGAWATVNGFQASLTTFFKLTLYQRYFSPGYTAFYAVPVAERRGANNESGIYIGFDFKPAKFWSVTGYFDQFSHPWLNYRADAPSKGYDFLGQVTFMPTRKLELYLRVRHRMKQENSRLENKIDPLENIYRTNYRLNITYEVSKRIKMRSRVEILDYRRADADNSMGYLIYQDLTYKSLKKPFSLSVRYTLFDAKVWDARMYAYENDVLYFYSIPPLYGRGMRAYLVFRWELVKHIDLWFKVAHTVYNDRTVISSGNSEIQGDNRTDIRAQMRFKF